MNHPLSWILLGELVLLPLILGGVAGWLSKRHKKRTFAAVEALLDRVREQAQARTERRSHELQSIGAVSADSTAHAAQALTEAEREFFRSLFEPLLKGDPRFPEMLERSLYRFSDQQVHGLVRLLAQAPAWDEGPPAIPPAEARARAAQGQDAVSDGEPGRTDLIGGFLPPLPELDETAETLVFPAAAAAADEGRPEHLGPNTYAVTATPAPRETAIAPQTKEGEIAEKLKALELALEQLSEPLDEEAPAPGSRASQDEEEMMGSAKGWALPVPIVDDVENATTMEHLSMAEQSQPRAASKPGGDE